MAKYHKKPVAIDAWQLTKENIEAGIPDWIDTEQVSIFGEANAFAEIYLFELTLHVNYGDYIIKGLQGEFYPCKPDIFEATYEEAESTGGSEEDLTQLSDFDLAAKRLVADSRSHKLALENYRRAILRQVEGKDVEFGKSVVTVEGMRGEYFVPSMEAQLSRYGYVKSPMLALQKITEKGEVRNKLQYVHQVRPSPDVTVIGEYDFGKKAGVKYNE